MEAFLTDSILQTLALLWIVVGLDALWRWPEAFHPLTLLRFLAQAMARKVLPGKEHSTVQHYISGALGATLLIAPILVLMALFIYLAEYPQFFEALVLLAVVDFGHIRHRFNRVVANVGKQKKVLTRELLAPMVARDCALLSDIGIAKAAIESMLLRFYYQYWAVLFWFVVAGPVAALGYRMMLTVSWQWHRRRPGFYHFVKPVDKLCRTLNAIPVFLGALAMMLVTHPVAAFLAMRAASAKDRTSLLLAMFGGGQGIRLGGPAIYQGHKYRYPRVGGSREVRYSDMVYCRRAITRATLLLLALVTVIMLLVWKVTKTSEGFGI